MSLMMCFIFLFGLGNYTTAQKSPYDHQTKTYVSSFNPVTLNAKLSVEGFFSPDHSVGTLSALISNATETLDIGTPSASTWIKFVLGTVLCSTKFIRIFVFAFVGSCHFVLLSFCARTHALYDSQLITPLSNPENLFTENVYDTCE